MGDPSGAEGAIMSRYSLLEHLLFPRTQYNSRRLEYRLEGKTVLITGASSGIGEQLAYLLADSHVHLILVARREDRLLEIKAEIEKKSAQVSVFPVDLREETELESLLAFLHQLPDGLDVIVSNAGHSIKRSILESLDRYHDFTRTMAINYSAPLQLLLSTIPLLEKSQGQIINVSTVNVMLPPLAYWAAYQASKAAFDTWFRSVAPELNMIGILTTSIYLPLVRTPMILPTTAYQKLPAMTPQHVARIIGNALYTHKRSYKPWWIIFGQLGSILFRWYWEYAIPRRLRRKGSRM
ncbi:MAG: SDR family NAD(P)-dependent oxidoreductase [Candidatus Cohnella colombiensis]|uniref:SDR family NAD(P)-dependent oxidoreductase n=1 Tax=Candidatus Cohnella colombiensis TaxID=3121368 RepID=A0AA95F3G6_9BACL|nr:MAG: SDR family NAD(P)-dependent oxidoreductase [Cohnella sp.]